MTTTQELPYDLWLEEALRGVVRRALAYAADYGLPGTHHFYLTFSTAAEGVELASDLRAKYPEEMTIVLQHQFWDPSLENDIFSVTLKFRGRSARIVIPLRAITAFGDPSVNFGLQLKAVPEEPAPPAHEPDDHSAPGADAAPDVNTEEPGKVIALDTFRKK